MSAVDRDVRAISRVSMSAWVIIVTLIATVVGWGVTTRATAETNKAQDAKIEQKADKDDVDRRQQEILDRVRETRQDIQELRRLVIEDMTRHGHPPAAVTTAAQE